MNAIANKEGTHAAKIAVIGCGWWSQGWHLPHLAANSPTIKVAAVVDATLKPASTLASTPLLSLEELSQKYNCPFYTSVLDLLSDPEVGPTLDGAIVATSHSSHFDVCMALLNEGIRRREMAEVIDEKRGRIKQSTNQRNSHRILNIFMEKPMTTCVQEANKIWEMSANLYPEGTFVINHTASYRPHTQVARKIVTSGQIGKIRHISASMNGPLMWLFNDPKNEAWVSKSLSMNGNGYAWGQIAHVLAWVYTVLGADKSFSNCENSSSVSAAVPIKVFCTMTHASNTGADVSLAAVISCEDGVTFSLSGSALLPGSQYTDPPVGKQIRVEIFGTNGSLMYGGDDRNSTSGRLELRLAKTDNDTVQTLFPCSREKGLDDGFYFEDGSQEGTGPGSMKAFLSACRRSSDLIAKAHGELAGVEVRENIEGELDQKVNDSLVGLRTVQIIDAMYRSSTSGFPELIEN